MFASNFLPSVCNVCTDNGPWNDSNPQYSLLVGLCVLSKIFSGDKNNLDNDGIKDRNIN